MKHSTLQTFAFVLFTILATHPLRAEKPPLPALTVPEGLGYNIHFTDAKPGEMEMLASSGAKIIRMDFSWGATEREKDVYDFSAFERLTDSLEKHGIRPLYILDYSNRHYDQGLSPYSEEGRKAFAKWAAAVALHFKDRGIIWEMYNEPNIHFWKPEPDPEKYILLALETGKALRESTPNELYIGPATSEIDFDFLEKCFKAGLLEYWDAVSVHPYRQRDPETVIPEYAKLRYMIDKYAPEGKTIPILSAEWGYSSAWGNYNDEIQGKMLPRQWMVNLASQVPISIWYDWHDDGLDPKEPEHHFGTVNHPYHKGRESVYDPKPSYLAAKTFNETFNGFKYNKALHTNDWLEKPQFKREYIFLFSKNDSVRLATWTDSNEPMQVLIPCDPGAFEVVSHLGEKLPDVVANEEGLTLTITDAPVYLTPKGKNEFLSKVAQVPSTPLYLYVDSTHAGKTIAEVKLPEKPMRNPRPFSYRPAKSFNGKSFYQVFDVISAEPIYIDYSPKTEGVIVHLRNPTGAPLRDKLTLFSHYRDGDFRTQHEMDIALTSGEKAFSQIFFVEANQQGRSSFLINLPSASFVEHVTLSVLDDFQRHTPQTFSDSWRIYPDGDANVASEQSLKLGENGFAEITYRFDDGWKFLNFAPKTKGLRKIEDIPKAMKLRVISDGSGNTIRMRFRDSAGQTFQVDGGKLTEKDEMFFSFDLLDKNNAHWGGPNDGLIHYPIFFESIIIDGTRKKCGPYTIDISSPVWSYSLPDTLP